MSYSDTKEAGHEPAETHKEVKKPAKKKAAKK